MEENNNTKASLSARKRSSNLNKKDSWTGSPIIVNPNFAEVDCSDVHPGKNKVHPLSCLKEQTSANQSIQLSSLTEQGPNLTSEQATTDVSNEDKERKKRKKKKFGAAVVLILATLVSLLIILLSWKLLASADRAATSWNAPRDGQDKSDSVIAPTSHQTSLDISSVNHSSRTSRVRLPATTSRTSIVAGTKDKITQDRAMHIITFYSSEAFATAALTNWEDNSSYAHVTLWETNMESSMELSEGNELSWKESRTSAEVGTSRKQSSHFISRNVHVTLWETNMESSMELSEGNELSWKESRTSAEVGTSRKQSSHFISRNVHESGRSSVFSYNTVNKVKITTTWVLEKTLTDDDSNHVTTGIETYNPLRHQSTRLISQDTSTVPGISADKSVPKHRGFRSSSNREIEEKTSTTVASYHCTTVVPTKPPSGLAARWQTSQSPAPNFKNFTTTFQSSPVVVKSSPSQTEKAASSGIYKETSVLVFPVTSSQATSETLTWNLATLKKTPAPHNSVINTEARFSHSATGMPRTRDVQQTVIFPRETLVGESSQEKISITDERQETSTKSPLTYKELLAKTPSQTVRASHPSAFSSPIDTSVTIPEITHEQASTTREIIEKATDTDKKFTTSSTTKLPHRSSSIGLAESEAVSFEKTSSLTPALGTASSNYVASHIHVGNTDASSAVVVLPTCTKGNTETFPHPTDCSKYIWCVTLQRFVMTCAKGTLFNPKTKLCDHPDQVKCNKV